MIEETMSHELSASVIGLAPYIVFGLEHVSKAQDSSRNSFWNVLSPKRKFSDFIPPKGKQ
jgi:hypothetical protein